MMHRAARNWVGLTILAGSLGFASLAVAQEDPFASPGSGEAPSPFDVGPMEESPDPFQPSFGEQPAAPQPGYAPPDPFALPEEAPQPGADPFAVPGQPQPGADPFAMPDQPQPGADPFAMPDQPQPGADPFAMPDTEDPFAAAPERPTSPPGVSPFDLDPDRAPTGPTRGINQLHDFRYVKRVRPLDGKEIVVRQRMTKEEAAEWDNQVKQFFVDLANEGELPNFVVGQHNADEWADWMVYANQLELWSQYCRDVVLVGTGFQFDPETDIKWPGTPAPQQQPGQAGAGGQQLALQQGAGGRPQRPTNIYNENRSIDDQLHDFNPIPDTRRQGGPAVIDPAEMNQQTTRLFQRFLAELRSQEQSQQQYMARLDRDLTEREIRRQAYVDWQESQLQQLVEFVDEWARRYEGRVLTIAGVRYELYRPGEVPAVQVRGANIVETDYDLTPYDLLNNDGTLRGASR